MAVDQSRPTSIPGVETLHRREVWQDPKLPVTGPKPTMAQWDTFPLHYTAAVNLPDGDLGEFQYQIKPYLQAIQRDYTTNRGYSIGYGFAVDWLGGVWELRGYDIKNAANLNWNHRTGPILCLVDGADPLTAEALWSVNALYAEANRRTGRTLSLKGHRDIGATACPGGGIYAQIQSGAVRPLTAAELYPPVAPEPIEPPPLIIPEEDDMTPVVPEVTVDTRINKGGRRLIAGQPQRIQVADKDVHEAFLHLTVVNPAIRGEKRYAYIEMAPDGNLEASVVNWNDGDTVATDGVPAMCPDGHVWVRSSRDCDLLVSVWAS